MSGRTSSGYRWASGATWGRTGHGARVSAGQRRPGADLGAVIHEGTQRDAVLFSVGANATHRRQRTNADKRKAVLTLLADAEWSGWSAREIARRCAVHPSYVDKLRAESSLPIVGSEPRTYTTKHGTNATMQTENIGRSRAATAVLASPSPLPSCGANLSTPRGVVDGLAGDAYGLAGRVAGAGFNRWRRGWQIFHTLRRSAA